MTPIKIRVAPGGELTHVVVHSDEAAFSVRVNSHQTIVVLQRGDWTIASTPSPGDARPKLVCTRGHL